MKVYIIKDDPLDKDRDYCIMKVPPDQEAMFLETYAGRIVMTGSSVAEVVIRFFLGTSDE